MAGVRKPYAQRALTKRLTSRRRVGSVTNIPAWPTTFPKKDRLLAFYSGVAGSIAGTATLTNAQNSYPTAKMDDWVAAGIGVYRHRFDYHDLWPTAGQTTLDATGYAAIKYVVQQFFNRGKRILLNPHDDQNGAPVNNGLHSNTAGGGNYNWSWFSTAWINFINQLVIDIPGLSADWIMLELVNEMGYGVASGTWAMATYNSFLATVIPVLRASLPDYTFSVDTYPLAAATHYSYNGTLLSLPLDLNLTVNVHCYYPTLFSQQGIGDDAQTSLKYISGMTWGMTLAQIGTYLASYTPAGYGTITAITNQVNWWRANYATSGQVDALGFTDQAIADHLSGVVSYCAARSRYLHIGEWSASGYGSATFPMPALDANTYERAISLVFAKYGLGNMYWLEQVLTDDPPLHGTVGANRFVASRVAANAARTPTVFRTLSARISAMSGKQLWFDSDFTIHVNGKVSQLTDLSGNLNHATQVITSQQPNTGLTKLGVIDVLGFSSDDGGSPNDELTFGNVTLTACSIFILAKVNTAVGNLGNIGQWITRRDANVQISRVDSVAKKLIMYDGARQTTSGVLPIDPQQWSVLQIDWTGGVGVSFFQNGVSVSANVDFGSPAASIIANAVCSWSATSSQSNDMQSAVVFNRVVNSTERQQIVADLLAQAALAAA